MKAQNLSTTKLLRLGYFAALVLCHLSAQANPISIPEKSVTPEITFLVTIAILLEAACIFLLLRGFRKPRVFLLWIVGTHLITYPAFLGLIWLLQNMRPALAVAFGELVVVLVEGTLIYLICRLVPVKDHSPGASLLRCWLASLAGNVCSMLAFPALTYLHGVFSRT